MNMVYEIKDKEEYDIILNHLINEYMNIHNFKLNKMRINIQNYLFKEKGYYLFKLRLSCTHILSISISYYPSILNILIENEEYKQELKIYNYKNEITNYIERGKTNIL